MSLNLKIDDTGLKRKMAEVKKAVDPAKMLDGVRQKFLRDIDKNFKSQGQELSGGWAKLSPRTIRARRNKSSRAIRILQDTGRLRQSFFGVSGSSQMVVRTNDIRASRLNDGKSSQHLPGRRMIHTKEQAKKSAIRLLDAFIKKRIRNG